ncbi:hypothetical protein M3Y98_00290300 [Aphelenchoides besseyi]|nr:hypothetical protein M3Y98_00290300 [Aphelenchoides besseyi]
MLLIWQHVEWKEIWAQVHVLWELKQKCQWTSTVSKTKTSLRPMKKPIRHLLQKKISNFAQRHQIAARQPRPVHSKAPMKDLSRIASFESKSTSDGTEDFKSLYELPKLSRHGSDSKGDETTKTSERRVGRAPTASKEDYIRDMNAFSRNRSTSSSSSSSNSSTCSSSSTTPIFDKNDDSRTSEPNSKRARKSQRSTGGALNLNGDSNSSNADSEKRRKSSTTQNSLTDTNANQMFQRNFSATRESSIYKSKSDSSESSSSDDDEDSSSTSSSTSPPPLPARLSRQESIGVEIQQDEESRLSGKSTSSIPPPPVLAPHEPIRGSADVGMSLFDHSGSRKSSTSTQSDTANSRSFAYGAQKTGQKDARNTDIFEKSDKEKSGTKTKTTTKSSDLLVRKEKKDKLKERSRLTGDDEKSKEKTAEKTKDAERLKEKLRSKDKSREPTETEKSNIKKEKLKEKLKDKSLKSRESPQPRAATSSTELIDVTAERKSKRKRELSEMSPSLVGKPRLSGSKEFEKATQPPKIQKIEKSLSKDAKERERMKESGTSRAKDAKPLKMKTVKDVKMLTKEISPSPLQQQSRKRSPSSRKKEKDEMTSFAKKPRIAEVEAKYPTTVDKTSARLKPIRTEEVRALKRTLPTTSQVNSTDEKRRKLRKIEKATDKLKDPDAPTKKDSKNSTPALPDIPEFTGRSSLSNLKNFRIPKVVDTEAAKNAEKEKEREKEVPVEKELEPTADRRKEKERDKDVRENSRDRWDRTERREFYPTEGYNDRRESYYDRRVDATSGFYPTEPTTPRENYPSARGGNFHYGRGNYHAASHHGLPPMATTGYPPQRPTGLTGAFAAHTGQSYSMHGDNPTNSLYQGGNERGVSHFRRPPITRGGRASNFGANPMRKPVPDQISSPPQTYPSNQRTSQYRDPSMTTPTNWVNYQGGPQVKERPNPTPPYHNNAPAQSTYQTISNERFDVRDRDYRPYRDRNVGGLMADSSGHSLTTGIDSSPTDGLQIDEET